MSVRISFPFQPTSIAYYKVLYRVFWQLYSAPFWSIPVLLYKTLRSWPFFSLSGAPINSTFFCEINFLIELLIQFLTVLILLTYLFRFGHKIREIQTASIDWRYWCVGFSVKWVFLRYLTFINRQCISLDVDCSKIWKVLCFAIATCRKLLLTFLQDFFLQLKTREEYRRRHNHLGWTREPLVLAFLGFFCTISVSCTVFNLFLTSRLLFWIEILRALPLAM